MGISSMDLRSHMVVFKWEPPMIGIIHVRVYLGAPVYGKPHITIRAV